jgi:hypothetical protein
VRALFTNSERDPESVSLANMARCTDASGTSLAAGEHTAISGTDAVPSATGCLSSRRAISRDDSLSKHLDRIY